MEVICISRYYSYFGGEHLIFLIELLLKIFGLNTSSDYLSFISKSLLSYPFLFYILWRFIFFLKLTPFEKLLFTWWILSVLRKANFWELERLVLKDLVDLDLFSKDFTEGLDDMLVALSIWPFSQISWATFPFYKVILPYPCFKSLKKYP